MSLIQTTCAPPRGALPTVWEPEADAPLSQPTNHPVVYEARRLV
jgi:hypothetical protein